ncbi:hypothetical protein VQ03_26430, partial [Methylobacterium tarhaniae]
HFIAMLGYDPGVGVGYDPAATLASLVTGVVSSLAALILLCRVPTALGSVAAGTLLSVGITTMHVVGMQGVQVPGTFVWHPGLAVAAVLLGSALVCAALLMLPHRDDRRDLIPSATLLSGGIALLHFLAMAAAEVVPDPRTGADAGSLPRAVIATGIATIVLAVLGCSALALVADRLRRMNRVLSEQKAALLTSEERLALALEAGSDGLWDCDLATGAVWTTDRWWHMLGYGPGEMPPCSSTWQALIHPDDRSGTMAQLRAHLAGDTPVFEREHRLRCKDGTWRWILTRAKVVGRDADGEATRLVGTDVDIGVRKEAESRIAHMAAHDALTDLPNRTLFRERLRRRLSEIAEGAGACALLCVDLDRFKEVNDGLGHLAGDALLREVALRLRSGLGDRDTAARLGGDEFAVLLASVENAGEAMARAQAVIREIGRPVQLGDQTIEIGASIGLAVSSGDGADQEALFRRADLALYKAKAEGRNVARAFDPAMDLALAERRRLEADLRRAIARDELVLHYQPQVRSAPGQLVGFEALVRWQHPVRGLVPPGAFIPLAEETGLILPLGEWVLRAACREAAQWPRPLKVAVNLSPRQFQKVDLPERVLAILTETGLSPDRLELEVTETVIINDMARAMTVLRRLKSFGIRIAMDDFGTGYSSLATLQAFPFDTIKIDRSFVSELERRPAAAVIVRAVLGLGRSLGMGVVAEGVETEGQLRFLIAEGCEEMQGYLFGKPQPVDQLPALMAGDAALAGEGMETGRRRASG